MKIIKDSIVALAREGRTTLQVPEICIGFGIAFEICPDDWFIKLSNNLPSRQGFLFLTRKGFEANKESLKDAYEKAGGVWSDFEKAAEKDFLNRRHEIRKKIMQLHKRIVELKEFL